MKRSSVAAAPRWLRLGSTVIPCARATVTSSRCGGCVGSVSCCSSRCRGQRGCGPCPFLPCSTVWAPSQRAAQRQRRRYKSLRTWARQRIRQVPRWQPTRALVVVGDRTYAALELLDAVRCMATVITRRRLDARLFPPPPLRLPHQKGRPPLLGERLPNLTDP